MLRNENRPLAATHRTPPQRVDRLAALGAYSTEARRRLDGLRHMATAALSKMSLGDGTFLVAAQTGHDGAICLLPAEADDARTAAIVALGLARMPPMAQRRALHGATAADLAQFAAQRAARNGDIETVALAAWARIETAHDFSAELFARLTRAVTSNRSIRTATAGQLLLAALAAGEHPETEALIAAARERLMAGQTGCGLFPCRLAGAELRSAEGIGTLADQAFAIAALARLAGGRRNGGALYAASAAAARLTALQGLAGQWWWGYGLETGRTVAPYPLHTACQLALVPMALLALMEAGGPAYWPAIVRGLDWIERHPETGVEPLASGHLYVWRQVTRPADPRVPARMIRESRAEDFGWMLYAWQPAGAASVRHKRGGRSHGHHHAGQ